MPARRGHGSVGQHKATLVNKMNNCSVDDDQIYKFNKDEIVWAKMKFFSAWPAKVGINL